MADTRPSGTPIIVGEPSSVVQEVAHIDERGRFHLLPRWTRRLNWFVNEQEFIALLVFAEPGRIQLFPWEPLGPQIVARYEELSNDPDGADADALRLIQDRYGRVSTTNRRFYIGDAALLHLGLPLKRGTKKAIYVAILPTTIELLSPNYRDAKLAEGHPQLHDLP